MDRLKKDRIYRHVRMATGQDSVEQKLVEESAELISDIAEIQKCILNGDTLCEDLVKNAIGEVADFFNTLEQVTGELDLLETLKSFADSKLERLHDRAIEGNLSCGMAWRT